MKNNTEEKKIIELSKKDLKLLMSILNDSEIKSQTKNIKI